MAPVTRRRVSLRLVAAVLVAGVALAVSPLAQAGPPADTPLAMTRLPGFALPLPAGFTSNGTYAQGNGKSNAAAGRAVVVSWMTRELLGEDTARLLVGGLSTILSGKATMALGPVTELVVAGQPARTAVVTGTMPGRMTWFACDGRAVIVMTLARDHSAERLHERVMRGARCTPEPHAAPASSLSATRTKGWFSVESADHGGLHLARHDGTVVLAVARHVADGATGTVPVGMVEQLLASIGMSATLGPAEKAQGADGPRTIWRGTSDEYHLIAAVWFCEAPQRVVMGVAVTPRAMQAPASRREAEAQLASVHCLRPGEASLALPAMGDSASDAGAGRTAPGAAK
jgi:hypothetical protein